MKEARKVDPEAQVLSDLGVSRIARVLSVILPPQTTQNSACPSCSDLSQN